MSAAARAGPSSPPSSTSTVTAPGADATAGPGDNTAFVPPDAADVIPGLDPRLEGLELDPAVGPDVSARLAAAQTRRDELLTDQARVAAALTALPVRQARLGASAASAAAQLAAAQARLDALSSAAYTDAAGSGPGVLTMLDGSLLDQQVRITMADAAARTLTGAARDARRARARAGRAARRLAGEEVSLRAQSARLASELPGADAQVAQWTALAVSDLPPRLVSGTGIPVVALDAYPRASRVLAITHSECGIQWWLLAGVADGGSGHGTVYPPIVGVALDGTNHTQAVADTDFGLLDDDPVWDHAVGPFQFTPATWAAWASDGNFDGIADPQNLYDSALAAARKLCADAGAAGLYSDDQITRALTPYAVEARLVAQKLARARQYESEGIGTVDPSVAPVLAARGRVDGVASALPGDAGPAVANPCAGSARRVARGVRCSSAPRGGHVPLARPRPADRRRRGYSGSAEPDACSRARRSSRALSPRSSTRLLHGTSGSATTTDTMAMGVSATFKNDNGITSTRNTMPMSATACIANGCAVRGGGSGGGIPGAPVGSPAPEGPVPGSITP